MRSVFVSDAMKWFYKLVQNRRMEESTDSETRFFLYALEEAMRYIEELHRTQERLVNEHNMATRTVQEWREALKEQRPGMERWIPVEERLPEEGEGVAIIILRDGEEYYRTGWIKEQGDWRQMGIGCVCGKVTHWCPLPAREKEEQDEDT